MDDKEALLKIMQHADRPTLEEKLFNLTSAGRVNKPVSLYNTSQAARVLDETEGVPSQRKQQNRQCTTATTPQGGASAEQSHRKTKSSIRVN